MTDVLADARRDSMPVLRRERACAWFIASDQLVGISREPVSPAAFSGDAPFVPGMDGSAAQSNEVALFAAQREARRGMDSRKRGLVISIVSVIVLIPLFTILPTGIFSDSLDRVSVAYLVDAVAKNVEGLVNWLTGGPVTTGVSIVIWQTLTVAVVGAALSLNGCVYQSALRNPLASPSTLGVMSGGTLGTLAFVLVFAVPQSAGEVMNGLEGQRPPCLAAGRKDARRKACEWREKLH